LFASAIRNEGPDRVAAFILEPVGGSSTGANVPRPDYLRTVRQICDRYDVLMIADEVLCGSGRTGTWTASESFGVTPDIITLGKGIAGGYAPVSAVLARDAVVEPIARGTGALLHAQTFSHHAVTCAAAVATLDYLDKHRLVERCQTIGVTFHQKLRALRKLPGVGDVRGRGLLAGIEFVANVETKEPFSRSTGPWCRLKIRKTLETLGTPRQHRVRPRLERQVCLSLLTREFFCVL
jgi:adenosylmethionine-8-amino-7-oxononanoate aminotransferase